VKKVEMLREQPVEPLTMTSCEVAAKPIKEGSVNMLEINTRANHNATFTHLLVSCWPRTLCHAMIAQHSFSTL
jgi:hypothetical protein